MLKRDSQSDPGTIVYLDDQARRVVATATPLRSGGFLVYGPEDTIIRASSELDADRLVMRFAFAL